MKKQNFIQYMKYILSLLAFCLYSISLVAQITIASDSFTTEIPKKIKPTIQPYDSLYPIKFKSNSYELFENKRYFKQKLFLPPKSSVVLLSSQTSKFPLKTIRKVNAEDPQRDVFDRLVGPKEIKENWTTVYKPKKTSGNKYSSSDSICNRYYTIIDQINLEGTKQNNYLDEYSEFELTPEEWEIYDIIHPENIPDSVNFILGTDSYDLSKGVLFIKLRDDITGDTLYTTEINKFISVGFFLKAKQLLEGKNFVWAPRYLFQATDNIEDYLTGSSVNVTEIGTKFKCVGVNLFPTKEKGENSDWSIIAILENEKGKISKLIKGLYTPSYKSFVESALGLGNAYQLGIIYQILTSSKIIIPQLKTCLGYDFYLEEDIKKLEVYTNELSIEYENKLQMAKQDGRNTINANLEAKKNFLQKCVSKYGKENGTLVANKKIIIGMTKAMCHDAWYDWNLNYPNYKVISLETKYGKTEVWTNKYISQQLYMVNGVVKEILKY